MMPDSAIKDPLYAASAEDVSWNYEYPGGILFGPFPQ
jgi:hypothetical protein